MITFREFIGESFLLEMPHIVLQNGKVVDLELEVHAKMKKDEFISYIQDWIDGKTFKSKYNTTMRVPEDALAGFIEKLINGTPFFKSFVVKTYGDDVWNTVLRILKSKT